MLSFPPPKLAIRYYLLLLCIGVFSLNANGQKAPQFDFPDELLTKVSAELINEIEQRYLADVGEYEQEGTAGKAYTPAEKNAGSSKTRQLVQSDPQPQTKYRVQMRPNEPLLINVSLNVK